MRNAKKALMQKQQHFLLLVCSNGVTILHHFLNINTSTAYVIARDLEMSFSIDMTFDITVMLLRFPILL